MHLTSAFPVRERFLTLAVAASVVVALGLIAFLVLGGQVFYSIDGAVKFIQAASFRRSGFRTMYLPYPGSALDPSGMFVPFEPPFVFRAAGQYQSIFPSAFAMLASVMVGWGPGALRVLAIAGGALTAAAAPWLSDRAPRWSLALIVTFAMPVWFYGTGAGESTLALAASTWAFVVAIRCNGGPDGRADLIAGLLLGAASIFRDESLLLLPGLAYARYASTRGVVRWVTLCAAVAGPILLMAGIDWGWLDRPPLAHLRHAVPLLNAVLPRARAVLPRLDVLTWPERLDTIVSFWWFGDGGYYLASAIALAVGLAFVLRRQWSGPLAVAVIGATAVVGQVWDVGPLVGAPKFLVGLIPLAPFVLFAFLPASPDAAPSRLRRVALITTASYMLLTLLSLSTSGGKGLGPRLTMGLWPLLAAAACEGIWSWQTWNGSAFIRRSITWAGLLMIAGALVMELGVALPALAGRMHEDQDALDLIHQVPDRVIVLDDDVNMQLVGPEYFDRTVLYVARPNLWPRLGDALAASGETRVLVLTRQPMEPAAIGPYRFEESWRVSRFWIGRWVR